MSKIVVTGGAGYIGNHTIVELLSAGYDVLSLDNYINSSPHSYERIKEITGKEFLYHQTDISNYEELIEILKPHSDIEGIIHFAALKSVSESVENPFLYFENNNRATINIAKCAVELWVPNLLFSSSCSVYGNVEPEDLPVNEETPMSRAESPYAYTKQNGEYFLEKISENEALKTLALRYFNPVGAHISGKLGEYPSERVNNLVPVITQTAAGIRQKLTVYGGDWSTRDGSCIRDYIHVSDIARAHVQGLEYLMDGKQRSSFDILNLGSGEGVSVLEAIHAFEEVTGESVNYDIGPRRPGDVEAIYSDSSKAKRLLGWKPEFGLKEMMKSAWEWQVNLGVIDEEINS